MDSATSSPARSRCSTIAAARLVVVDAIDEPAARLVPHHGFSLGAALATAIALSSALASAHGPVAPVDASPVRLRWSAPEGCPDAAAVQRQIDARLRGGGRAVEASGVVRRDGEREWTLNLEVRTSEGHDERELHASSCASLSEAAGLLIAIAADPSADVGEIDTGVENADTKETPAESVVPRPPDDATEVDPAPTPEPPAPAEVATPRNEPPAAAPRSEPTAARRVAPRVRGLVRVDGAAQLPRVLPRILSGGIGGAVGLLIPHARVEARGRYMFAQRATYASRPEIGGEIGLWTISASGCWAPRAGPVEIPVCAGVELGRMRARSFGVTEDGEGRSLWVALPIDAAVVWAPIPWLALRVGPEVAPVLRRPRFHVRDLDELFRAAPAAVRLVGGIEARFP